MKDVSRPEYEGNTEFEGLRPVLDPRDHTGVKNAMIHALHSRALRAGTVFGPRRRYATAFDFGCGIGRLTPELLALADEVVGIDPDEALLRRARQVYGGGAARFVTPDAVPSVRAPGLVVAVYVLCIIPRGEVVRALRDLRSRAGSDARLVVIDRVTRVPGADPGDIEPRDVAWYRDAFAEAGWRPRVSRRVRRAESLPMTFNVRVSSRLPTRLSGALVSACARAEWMSASRGGRGEYADALMVADAAP